MLGSGENRLKQPVDLGQEITLVPFSGVQILDFGFDMRSFAGKPSKFIEREVGQVGDHAEHKLIPLTGDDARDAKNLEESTQSDVEYSIRAVAALEPFLEKWVPVPVFRMKSQRGPNGLESFDPGPTNWARLRTVELDAPDHDTGHTHRVQLAFDTNLVETGRQPLYVAPEIADAEKPREFRLVSDPDDVSAFLRRTETDETGQIVDLQLWVSNWLKEIFMDFKRAERPGRPVLEENLPYRFEHWARFIAYLHVLTRAIAPPKIHLADTVSGRDAVRAVDVDLVLDVGNSRTCGILIEQFAGEQRVELARSFPLEIRDLSAPEFQNAGLFQSRVEFAELSFGDDRFASQSGRRNSFIWPSFVRLGPEAIRLVQGEEGTETASGLSSPKRYLWDSAPMAQDWRFHNHNDPNNLPKSVRAAMRHLNEAGDVLAQLEAEVKGGLRKPQDVNRARAIRPRFSRSSMFGFMLAEIIAHALVQVNDAASRARRPQSDLPRRLKRIILSLPTATSVQEQAIITSRARGALHMVWSMLGIGDQNTTISEMPQLLVNWDEASCTQLVYLYSEVTQKFEGRIDTFLKLKGTKRQIGGTGDPRDTLRIACIDIGGGTTDLMITTYHGEANRVLHPEQTFREGFRVAGDDLVHRVISAIIIPALQTSIENFGGRYVGEKLRELFGGDIGGQDQQSVQRRRQYSIRVLVPLAEAILARSEESIEFDRIDIPVHQVLGLTLPDAPDPDDGESPETREATADGPEPHSLSETLDYIQRAARETGAADWDLRAMTLSSSREDVDAISREVFQKALSNMCEVIDHIGVDLVLLTGRPSRLPAVRSVVEEMLVVPPHRLISMHKYRTGRWYPFRDPVTQRIGDPKSTVAVGGMLIALSEGRIPNFKVSTEAFQMRSTARFIGEMDSNGQIQNDRILFSNIDMDQAANPGDQTATVEMFAPIYIGARQLPLERWTTTPLYRLDFANAEVQRRPSPLKVTLEKDDGAEDDAETRAAILRRETLREAFRVTDLFDGDDHQMKRTEVVLKLQTLGFDDDYWLDTGIYQF